MIKLYTGELRLSAASLRAGDAVTLSGTVYTARDAAHKRISEMTESGIDLPFSLQDAVIYYAGPTRTPRGRVCGAFGPTTSCRMDAFTPLMLKLGVAATIGKGTRSEDVIKSIIKYKCPYFAALGGAGALAARHITENEVTAFEELGCESVKRLVFDNFPLYVAVDIYGNSIYERRN